MENTSQNKKACNSTCKVYNVTWKIYQVSNSLGSLLGFTKPYETKQLVLDTIAAKNEEIAKEESIINMHKRFSNISKLKVKFTSININLTNELMQQQEKERQLREQEIYKESNNRDYTVFVTGTYYLNIVPSYPKTEVIKEVTKTLKISFNALKNLSDQDLEKIAIFHFMDTIYSRGVDINKFGNISVEVKCVINDTILKNQPYSIEYQHECRYNRKRCTDVTNFTMEC